MTDINTMTREQLIAHIAGLKKVAAGKLSMKVTDGGKDGKGSIGALSIYGMGRFPLTLYRGQWERLLNHKDEILSFIEANSDKLTTKE